MSTHTPAPGATGSATSGGAYQSTSDAIAQSAGVGAAGQALATQQDYRYLYGPAAEANRLKFFQATGMDTPTSTIASVTDLKNEFYKWDDDYRNQFRNKLSLLDKNWATATDDQLNKQWQALVDQSSAYLQNGQSLTPWDILGRDISSTTAALKNVKPTTKTVTDSSTQYTSALDSEALFTQAAQSLLGRKPTASEVAAFQGLLRSQEAANPVTTVTTQNVNAAGDVTSQTQSQTGGLSADARALLAQQQAESSSDYGEHQAATTLMNWLTGAAAGGQ